MHSPGRLQALFALFAGVSVLVAAAFLVPRPLAPRPVPVGEALEAETMALLRPGMGQPFSDVSASGRAGLLVWGDATAVGTASTRSASTGLVVRARGDQCQGAPQLRVSVDGVPTGRLTVLATTWTGYTLRGTWSAGAHRVELTYLNDGGAAGCDRNVNLDQVQFTGTGTGTAANSPATATPAAAPAPPGGGVAVTRSGPITLEAEAMALPSWAGMSFTDSAASGQAGLLIWSDSTATGSLAAASSGTRLVVRARGDQCEGAPQLRVTVDGGVAGLLSIPATSWTDYTVTGTWAPGPHRLELAFANDGGAAGCDRNVTVDRVQLGGDTLVAPTASPAPASSLAPPPSSPALTSSPLPSTSPVPTARPAAVSGNPFVGSRAYADPASPARAAADVRRAWDPTGAAALDKIARNAAADWYGDWTPTGSLASTVSSRIATLNAAGAVSVLVAYDIPHRDCGSYSAGGAPTAEAYRQWIAQLAAGIGTTKTVVVLEPDALPQMDCLSSDDQHERTALLSAAVTTLTALPATTVYLDAGGATWQPAATMAVRLQAAGVDKARGFSLNVSGFNANVVNLPYGDEVSRLLGGNKHFLLDSSRNGAGAGAGDTWCNPTGRALGTPLTTDTGDPLADAATWIKAPGESDGTCGGGPPAGQFWTDYAIGLGRGPQH